MRSLVVHGGGIGDFIIALPALEALRARGSVEVAGIPERVALAVRGGLAEAAHDLDVIHFHTLFTEPDKTLRAFLGQFDSVVVYMREDDAMRERLAQCGVQDISIGAGVPPDDWPYHASRWYLSVIGIDEARPSALTWEIVERESIDIVVHPGSGGRNKNWPVENFAAVSSALRDEGRHVTWLVGPAEEDIAVPPGIVVMRPGTLSQAADILASASTYLGNDSGMTHIAAALGTRTTAIFGPTDPAVWAPLGDHVSVVHGAPWPSVEDVYDAITRP